MATFSFPASIPQGYYGVIVPRVTGLLLGAGVSAIPTTARNMIDVAPLEIATGGGYTRTTGYWGATTAVQFPDFQSVADDTNGRTEIGPTTAVLAATNTMTVTFRWIVFCSDNKIINAVDYGTAQSIENQPLTLNIAASSVIANSWPIQVFHRTS